MKKLRRGDLHGNRFRIVLRGVTGDRDAIEVNLRSQGAPNYFGAQRFGFEGGNVEQGRAMLAREIRVRNPKKKGLYLSAVEPRPGGEPGEMAWEWPQADRLVLAFSLPAGNYATSVLNEILRTIEPDRHMENEPAAAE